MNKRILISLSVIGLVAAIAIGGTIAYFSDTETSTGNLFAAGSIDLKVDNECWKGGEYTYGSDCTWSETDLNGELFFYFSDLKPGDWGEDTVSLRVYNNDAWACVTFDNLVSDDNTCVEPELEVEPGCELGQDGELAENLEFFFWADMCFIDEVAEPGDNIFTEEECEEGADFPLMWGYADEIIPSRTYTLAAPGEVNVFTGEEDEPLTGSEDYYIGKAWCFGEWIPNGEDGYYCDGSEVGNESQTDSLSGNITFYAEQARNNPNFRCVQPIHVTSGPLYYGPTGWGGWSCPANTTVVDGSLVVSGGDLAQTFAWKPGATTDSVNYPSTPFGYTYGSGETGYIGQNDNDSGETIYLDFDCMPN